MRDFEEQWLWADHRAAIAAGIYPLIDKLVSFFHWWESHQQWPASEPARIEERCSAGC